MNDKWIVVWWQYDYDKNGIDIWPLNEYESEDFKEEEYARQQLWGGAIVKTKICETEEEAKKIAYGL